MTITIRVSRKPIEAVTTAFLIFPSFHQPTDVLTMRMVSLVFLLFFMAEFTLLDGNLLDPGKTPLISTTVSPDEKVSQHNDAAEEKQRHDHDEEGRVDELLLRTIELVIDKAMLFVIPPATIHLPITTIPKHEDFEKWLVKLDIQIGISLMQLRETLQRLLASIGEEKLIILLDWLRDREGMRHHADILLQMLLGSGSKTAYKTLHQVWLEKRIEPEDLFGIVDSWLNGKKLWLEYTELYRKKYGAGAFSVAQTLKFLNEAYNNDSFWIYGGYFPVIKEDADLKSLAESMEKLRFVSCLMKYYSLGSLVLYQIPQTKAKEIPWSLAEN